MLFSNIAGQANLVGQQIRREVNDAVFGGRRLVGRAAGQLGIGASNGEYLYPHQLVPGFDHKINDGLRPVPLVWPEVLGRPHRDICRAKWSVALVRGNDGSLDRRQEAGHATEPFGQHRAGEVRLDRGHRIVGIEIAVVEAVGQHDYIWSEPVAADV
jgi:hypothetical protein